MNADGSAQTRRTNNPPTTRDPTGSRSPSTPTPAPTGASPMRASLVTAYDAVHRPEPHPRPAACLPLVQPAPRRSSDHLTVGTADSNGQVVRYESYRAVEDDRRQPRNARRPGRRARSTSSPTACSRTRSPTTPASCAPRSPLQITDKDNTPHPGGPGAATTQEFTFDVDATCSVGPRPHDRTRSARPPPPPMRWSPAPIKEGRRSIWQLGQVRRLRRRPRRRHRHRRQHGVRAAGDVRPVAAFDPRRGRAKLRLNPPGEGGHPR